ncbi:MAG: universal stress protein [Betaproteobacteria bacterium]
MTFKSILVATDFSDSARHAAYRGAVLAAESGAQLELLHVMSRPSLDALRGMFLAHLAAEAALIDDVRSMLSELGANISSDTGVAANARVSIGNVLDDILAASEQADMTVLGARGLNPLRDSIIGTTAERLLRKIRRPVLVVKRESHGTYNNVLVPVDLSEYSASALNLALTVAPTAQITLVHAFDLPFEGKLRMAGVSHSEIERNRAHAQQQALSQIRSLTENVHGNMRRFADVVDQADPRRLIVAREKTLRAELIVLAKHGSMVEDFFVGSVTRHVLSYSQCDVLVDTTGAR